MHRLAIPLLLCLLATPVVPGIAHAQETPPPEGLPAGSPEPEAPEAPEAFDSRPLIDAARSMSTRRAAQLEAELEAEPGDLTARAALLKHYAGGQHYERDERLRHLLWWIENRPTDRLTSASYCRVHPRLDPEAYRQAEAAWERQLEAYGDDAAVLANASDFFGWDDPKRSLELLRRARALEPENREWSRLLDSFDAVWGSSEELPVRGRHRLAVLELVRALELVWHESAGAADRVSRLMVLDELAKKSLAANLKGRANRYARELLREAPSLRDCRCYGDAVHRAHTVLGHLALANGDQREAVVHLLASGRVPASPRLAADGPSMSLAAELLEAGASDAVLAYLQLAGLLWTRPGNHLADWTAAVRAGEQPDFRPNVRF